MSEFLADMVAGSAVRLRAAREIRPTREMIRLADLSDRPVMPKFHPRGFDVLAEVKRRSPSEGDLLATTTGKPSHPTDLAATYHEGGALAISVLTEPDRFAGDLADIGSARTCGLPVMRKDFLIDPYQVWEARAHGADGVLIILKILDDDRLLAMLEAVRRAEMFALLEAFDRADIERLDRIGAYLTPCDMIGLNSRNLENLEVQVERFADLVDLLPAGPKRVAESGLSTAADSAHVASLGFDVALVGSALVRSNDPGSILAEMIRSGRAARAA